jgi:hypothetical protein
MDMTRDCITKIQETAAPHEINYAGRNFVDKPMTALPRSITASPLETETLTSIVDYIKSKTDNASMDPNRKFVVHVAGYNSIELYKELNEDKERDHLISAEFECSDFPYGIFQPIENFIINLQSLFVQDENVKALLEFVGSVKNDSSAEQTDDGVSQKVTVKQGIALAKVAKVPNPVYLRPFRTFSEIEQPQSAFVFRLRKNDVSGVTAALFEADGSAWKHETISKIQTFLTDELEGQPVIILA